MNTDFVSLFSGAGGLDLGLEAAGWNCRYASDIDIHAVETMLRNREAGSPTRQLPYLSNSYIEQADVRNLTGRHILEVAGARKGDISLLAGGPPCQSWSSAGHQLGFEDPRGKLWSDFVRLAVELDARYLVFENVRGLLTARGTDGVPGSALAHIRSRLFEVGFNTTVSLLNAADYGVPQRRVRLFIIGYREGDAPEFPRVTHDALGASVGLLPWISLGSTLCNIDGPSDSEIIRPSGKMAEDLMQIEPGSGVKSIGKIEATRPNGHWGYKQGAFVADLNVPARTVTASAQQDWIRDPKLGLRRLSTRECAAIQTFPKDYIWPERTQDQYRLIGNSVPPILAQAVGSSLLNFVGLSSREKSASSTTTLAPLPPKLAAAISYTMREERTNGSSRRNAVAKRRVRIAAWG